MKEVSHHATLQMILRLLEVMVQGSGWFGREYCPLLAEVPHD